MNESLVSTTRTVRTVIVPAAGMGTRFLPATKTLPKELLPVVDTPGIELIAEEAAQLGAERLAIITAPRKDEVLAHFDSYPDLEKMLAERGKNDQLAKVQRASQLPKPVPVVQEKPLGLGHAVGLAEAILDDAEDCVAVMLPDDLVLPSGVVEKMVQVQAVVPGATMRGSRAGGFGVLQDKVADICATDDAICDAPLDMTDALPRAADMVAANGVHAWYASNEYVIPGTTANQWVVGWAQELINN